jgi:hypothetical protein
MSRSFFVEHLKGSSPRRHPVEEELDVPVEIAQPLQEAKLPT